LSGPPRQLTHTSHVESVQTYYEPDSSGGIDRSPRAVVSDEFPGEAFTSDLGPEAFDFATWLARSLRGDIDNRRDMFDTDLYSDDWVRTWLEGTIGEDPDPNSESDSDDPIVKEVERVIHVLSRVGELPDARDSAAEILSEYRDAVEELGVAGILTEFVDGTTPEDEVYRALEDPTEKSRDSELVAGDDWYNIVINHMLPVEAKESKVVRHEKQYFNRGQRANKIYHRCRRMLHYRVVCCSRIAVLVELLLRLVLVIYVRACLKQSFH
jgi:hypothetical protein